MEICSVAKFLLLSVLSSTFIVCSTGALLSPIKDVEQQQLEKEEQTSLKFQLPRPIMHDFFNFPATTTPTVTVPPDTSAPAVITVPSSTPFPITPTPPSAPVTVPPTTPATTPPVTVPPTTPATTPPTNNPGVTNPVTTPNPNNPGVTNPITTPVLAPPGGGATTAPAGPGQSWCVAKSGVPEKNLQSALDYACGIGKADCSSIQQGAGCYNPNTLQNHASVAFNNYYQKNPVPTSCDFGSTAMVTTANPSTGSCIYTSSSSSSSPTTASPTTTPPTNPTSIPTPPSNPTSIPTPPTNPASTPTPVPTTSSSTGAAPTGSGAPPGLLNGSFPGLGGDPTGFGQGPTAANMTSSVPRSSNLQHFMRSILVVAFITAGIALDV